MEDLSKYTATELLKLGNDIKARHDALKQEIIDNTYEIEELEKNINDKVQKLEQLEKNYVEIVEKLSK